MIQLTKINNEEFVLNSAQIEVIEMIPESKVVLTNGKYYIVQESMDEIIQKVVEYNARIYCRGRGMELEERKDRLGS